MFPSIAAHTQPPTFPSNGFIPFAQGGQPHAAPPVFNLQPPSYMSVPEIQQEAREKDIWEVPDTPAK